MSHQYNEASNDSLIFPLTHFMVFHTFFYSNLFQAIRPSDTYLFEYKLEFENWMDKIIIIYFL